MSTDSQDTGSTENYTPEDNHIIDLEEKFIEVKEFVEKVKDKIAEDPNTCYYAYKTFVCSAIENFFEFLFTSPDSDINWEDLGYELHYDVNIDKNLNRVDFIVNETHIKDEETFNKKHHFYFCIYSQCFPA